MESRKIKAIDMPKLYLIDVIGKTNEIIQRELIQNRIEYKFEVFGKIQLEILIIFACDYLFNKPRICFFKESNSNAFKKIIFLLELL